MSESEGALLSPGQMLAAARRARGLALPALAASTRIAEQFLLALEEDEHDVLPPLYIRSFLRTYAAALGLAPEEVLASYDRQVAGPEGAAGGAPVWEQEVTVRRVGDGGGSRRRLRWVGLVALALIVVLAAVLVLERSGRRAFGPGLGPGAAPSGGAAADSGVGGAPAPAAADSANAPRF